MIIINCVKKIWKCTIVLYLIKMLRGGNNISVKKLPRFANEIYIKL